MYNIRSNKVETGSLGSPVIRKVNIKVPLVQGTSTYAIEENSPLERSYPLGLWVTKPGIKADQTKTQATGTVFDSAYIIIRHQDSVVHFKLPFHQVYQANLYGRPYVIHLPGAINLSESSIEVPDNAVIPANTVLEFQVDYVKPA